MMLSVPSNNILIDQILSHKVSDITTNSCEVKKNSVFIAIKGVNNDGHNFIDNATEAGAKIIVTDENYVTKKNDKVLFFKVQNTRKFLSELSARFYPNQPENMVAVTGTAGKTSTVNFYQQIWKSLGKESASIGSLGILYNKGSFTDEDYNGLNTLDPISLHHNLNELAKANINYVAMEASSHGLDQYRINGVKLKAAAFTNFSQDHLDYHENFENYFKAKIRLFSDLLKNNIAVLNADIDEYDILKEVCISSKNNIIDYGKKAEFIKLTSVILDLDFQTVTIEIQKKIYSFKTKLLGEFQIYNMLCALGLAIASGADIEKAVSTLEHLVHVPGRMQKVQSNANKSVYIDYSHKPEALKKALELAKDLAKNGKLYIIFGCGGDRDRVKRPIMGKIASEIADLIIITDDNPRYENPATIRSEIINGINSSSYIEIADRQEAIKYGIDMMGKEDLLIIAGKGHENYQIIGKHKKDFDDYKIAQDYLDQNL